MCGCDVRGFGGSGGAGGARQPPLVIDQVRSSAASVLACLQAPLVNAGAAAAPLFWACTAVKACTRRAPFTIKAAPNADRPAPAPALALAPPAAPPLRAPPQLWDVRSQRSSHTFAGKYPVTAVAFSEAGELVYAGGVDNQGRRRL